MVVGSEDGGNDDEVVAPSAVRPNPPNPPVDGAGAAAAGAEDVAAPKLNPMAAFGASPEVGAAAAVAAPPTPPKLNPTLGGSPPAEKENPPPPPEGAGALASGAPKLKAIFGLHVDAVVRIEV